MIDKYPVNNNDSSHNDSSYNDSPHSASIVYVVDDKLCINGKVFEHHELRESKEYLQSITAEKAVFYPKNEEEVDKLHKIIIRMGERDRDNDSAYTEQTY